jgi:hypothetical protein
LQQQKLLAGAAGVASAATPGCHELDAQLFARWREYLKSEIELNAAQDARDLMSWNARQAYPPKPDCIESSWVKVISAENEADELWSAATDMEVSRHLTNELKAEVTTWAQKCYEINIRFGLPELEAALDNGLPSIALLQRQPQRWPGSPLRPLQSSISMTRPVVSGEV